MCGLKQWKKQGWSSLRMALPQRPPTWKAPRDTCAKPYWPPSNEYDGIDIPRLPIRSTASVRGGDGTVDEYGMPIRNETKAIMAEELAKDEARYHDTLKARRHLAKVKGPVSRVQVQWSKRHFEEGIGCCRLGCEAMVRPYSADTRVALAVAPASASEADRRRELGAEIRSVWKQVDSVEKAADRVALLDGLVASKGEAAIDTGPQACYDCCAVVYCSLRCRLVDGTGCGHHALICRGST